MAYVAVLEWPMWLCWNGLPFQLCNHCFGMASMAVLEWPVWLCWNGLCGCVGMASAAVLEQACVRFFGLFFPTVAYIIRFFDPFCGLLMPNGIL